LPSGDHAGLRSREPGELVRFRGSPCSAGTVKMSPRAASATRLAEGERSNVVIHFATFFCSGRVAGLSSGTRTDTFVAFSPGRSMT
jgi:hypothetical protein